MKNNDIINKPEHYTQGVEPFEIIKNTDKWEGYLYGNVVKYMQRYPHKGNPIQDLLKAEKYLTELIEHYKNKEEEPVTKEELKVLIDRTTALHYVKEELTYFYTHVDRINFIELDVESVDEHIVKYVINQGSKNMTIHCKANWAEINSIKLQNHIHRLKGKNNV